VVETGENEQAYSWADVTVSLNIPTFGARDLSFWVLARIYFQTDKFAAHYFKCRRDIIGVRFYISYIFAWSAWVTNLLSELK
jgi:hypothetical protein